MFLLVPAHPGSSGQRAVKWLLLLWPPCVAEPPFPQIDIIRAVVIVWRVRGKTIRSVL